MNKARELPSSPPSESEGEGRRMSVDDPPATWPKPRNNVRKRLSKQLSMRETTREAAWEKRRQQIYRQQSRMVSSALASTPFDRCEEGEEEVDCPAAGKLLAKAKSLTDEDLNELRGSIELGFGFTEEDGGHDLCHTLPALDLYFAVQRQLSDPKLCSSPSSASTPTINGGGSSSSLVDTPSPRSPAHPCAAGNAVTDSPPWKIFSPGDNPKHVKTRLRHWAQAVACSVLLNEWNGASGNE